MTVTLAGLIGITLIVSFSSLFAPLRRLWPKFFGCSQCVGMWVGGAAGGTGLIQTGHGQLLDILFVGAAISFLALLASAIIIRLLDT